ncbi:MAG: peptidylprolyl isomerase [Clostridiaceae bacterium]|nr:peptidylprolyl isomerase [Clostridiaceae bacterium]
MKNIKKILIAGAIGVFVISSVGCNMVAKTPEAIKRAPVATVNGETITKEQLDLRMVPTTSSFETQYGKDWKSNPQYVTSFEEERTKTRQGMIDDIVILQHAKDAKVIPTDKVIDDEAKIQLEATVKQVGDEAKFAEALKQYGFTKETYTTFLKGSIKVSKAVEGLLKDVKVEDAKVQAEYDANKTTKYTKEKNLVHIFRILSIAEADSKAIIERLNKGEDFAKVATEISTDAATKASGGELGDYFYDESQNQGNIDPQLGKAAMTMDVNKISAPIKTTEGFNIIKVTKKVVSEPKAFADVKEEIRTTLLNALKQTTITTNIKKWEDDLGKKLVKYDKNM